MQSVSDIRRTFLEYFRSNGHENAPPPARIADVLAQLAQSADHG